MPGFISPLLVKLDGWRIFAGKYKWGRDLSDEDSTISANSCSSFSVSVLDYYITLILYSTCLKSQRSLTHSSLMLSACLWHTYIGNRWLNKVKSKYGHRELVWFTDDGLSVQTVEDSKPLDSMLNAFSNKWHYLLTLKQTSRPLRKIKLSCNTKSAGLTRPNPC